ncbi:hypothetical protein JG687_00010461 [Phytophthora cactorum]|uniref:Uncharacterized protein n=1 Tax=Phytophthora cactorum TaxID=29920 RepID=A0A329RNP4_9STRA|nr:hypothetical protein Pcac1_g18638 [Phytophthora cactorum]KAG2810072.1 hypothetical protein PC112_g16219 [Phytophthora cactorum]KAG2811063.1 hypothetical protein PC111_g15391 [Phytophthora cactorum]KAG2851019.1 hypothetical protein PC113_g16271 [Phytophthora cactorum]KAG2890480.1 hypothetical protein PC114_g17449 [Phytophthora cactorum]
MTTDHDATEAPEAFPAESCTESLSDKDANASQDSSKSPTEAAPTFAFVAWKADLELMLQRESETLHESVQSLQGDFDDRSQFIRGDFAWRKQITAFHDQLQDVLTNQLNDLATNVSKHAAQVAESLAQTLAKVERDGQRAVHQQEQKGEAALRRARTALAKEVERVARLEKCLRLEEARQAAATLAERERQLTAEHNARESHLQALLGDMRASNDSLETLNSQLLEALRTSRTELEQLRNTLVRSISRPKARVSSLSHSESKNGEGANRSRGDKGGKNSISRGLESFPSTANEFLLVPQLRQSLKDATQTVANLKARLSELESTQDSDKQRLRELQLALAQAENEKARATKLLGEARLALIDNENMLVEAANESVRLQDKFDTLQALAQGRERVLADSQRLEDATRDQLDALKSRLERVMAIEVRWREFEHAVAKWRETMKGANTQTWESTCSDDSTRLERIVESFLRLETSEGPAPIEVLRSMETQKELDIRLRYEFERRFGDQLSLRISHERRHVLERLEYLCAAEAKDKQERPQRTRQSVSRTSNLESDFTRLKRLLKAAYDQLGICVDAWSETDLDGLHARLEALRAQVQTLENKLEAAAKRAESQRVSFVRAELAQQEKDLLLAELTSRYRQLRSAQVAQQQEQLQHRQPIERKPLTVYGIPQPMVQKPKLQALLTQLPVRSRPASAAACLESVRHQSPCRVSHAPPSRLGSRLVSNRTIFDLQRKPNDKRVEEVEEHVRSVLKSALMQSDVENQLEDTVGSDGVLEILHRRRHRK